MLELIIIFIVAIIYCSYVAYIEKSIQEFLTSMIGFWIGAGIVHIILYLIAGQ